MGTYITPVEDQLVLPASVRLPPGQEAVRRISGQEIPRPVPIRLLVDTGSRRTTLIPGIVRHLQVPSAGEVRVMTPLSSVVADVVWVCLEFPGTNLATFSEVLVTRLAMPPGLSHFHGLLGRDLMRRWDALLYEGRRNCLTLRDEPGLFSWLRRRL